MPAKNEILPLDAGPSRNSIAPPVPLATKLSKRSEAANLDATTAQERRIRLVTQQRRHTAFQLFYALFGIALMVVQMEYLWFANTKDFDGVCHMDETTGCPTCLESLAHALPVKEGRMMLHALRVLISFSTIILLYYIYAFYAAECDVLKIKNIVPPSATLLSSPLRNRLMLELLVFAVHPFPGLETIDPRWPNLVVASSLVMFLRVLLLFRVVQFRNSFNSSNGWFIGALTNVDYTTTFFLKSTLKNYPSRCILCCFLMLLIVTGYSLYVVERYLCAFLADSCCVPLSFADALWSLVITMLTIGYGDVVPQTSAGRFFAVIAGLFGTVFTAVTIAVMSSYLVLTRSEHKVNAFLKKDDNRRLVNEHAARAIQAYVQLRAVQRRFQGTATTKRGAATIQKAEQKLYDVLRVYRQVKRFVNSHDVSDPMDKQMTMLEMMEVNVEYIRTKIEDLSELFHSQVDKSHKNKRKLQTAAITTRAAVALVNAGAAAAPASASTTSTAGPMATATTPAATSATTTTPTSAMSAATASTAAAPVVALSDSRGGGVGAGGDDTVESAINTGSSGSPGSTSSSTIAATSAIPWAGVVPGQASIYESDSDVSSPLRRSPPGKTEPNSDLVVTFRRPNASSTPSSSSSCSTSTSTSSASGATPTNGSASASNDSNLKSGGSTQGSSRHLLAAVGEMPDWAIVLESSMHSILVQVTRVSGEMDSLQRRVQSQMDQLQTRMGDIEKRLGVQDAFREITRGASTRKLLVRTPSTQQFVEDHNGGGGGGTGGGGGGTGGGDSNGTGGGGGGGSNYNLGGATRFSRISFSNRKPSIHNFVTPKDLEEFQNGGD